MVTYGKTVNDIRLHAVKYKAVDLFFIFIKWLSDYTACEGKGGGGAGTNHCKVTLKTGNWSHNKLFKYCSS